MKPWSARENPSKMVEFIEFSDKLLMVYDWNMVENGGKSLKHGGGHGISWYMNWKMS